MVKGVLSWNMRPAASGLSPSVAALPGRPGSRDAGSADLRGRRNLRDYGSDAQNRLFCRFVRLRGVSAAWSRAAGRKGEFGL
jgi:hypothetical protein